VISAATTHFLGMPDPLTLASTSSDYGERYQVQTEVETVSQSTINLATETDIDAISVAIPMFLGASFSLVY